MAGQSVRRRQSQDEKEIKGWEDWLTRFLNSLREEPPERLDRMLAPLVEKIVGSIAPFIPVDRFENLMERVSPGTGGMEGNPYRAQFLTNETLDPGLLGKVFGRALSPRRPSRTAIGRIQRGDFLEETPLRPADLGQGQWPEEQYPDIPGGIKWRRMAGLRQSWDQGQPFVHVEHPELPEGPFGSMTLDQWENIPWRSNIGEYHRSIGTTPPYPDASGNAPPADPLASTEPRDYMAAVNAMTNWSPGYRRAVEREEELRRKRDFIPGEHFLSEYDIYDFDPDQLVRDYYSENSVKGGPVSDYPFGPRQVASWIPRSAIASLNAMGEPYALYERTPLKPVEGPLQVGEERTYYAPKWGQSWDIRPADQGMEHLIQYRRRQRQIP